MAALVALAVLAASLAGAWTLHRHGVDHAEEFNAERAAQAEESLRDIVGDVGVLLRVAEGFLAEQAFATEDEFERFVMRVAQPGAPVAGVAWVPVFGPERAAGFEAALERPIRRPAEVATPGGGPAGADGTLAPVMYFVAPGGGRPDVAGTDLWADPLRRSLLRESRMAGGPRLSAPTPVLPDGEPGLVLALAGTGPFPGGGRSEGAVLAPIPFRALAVAMAARTPGAEVRLDEGGVPLLGDGGAPADAAVRTVALAGRTLTVTAWGPAGDESAAAVAVAVLGTVAAGLLGLLLIQGSRRERRVAREVTARTRELAAERDRSSAVVGRAQDGIAIVGPDGAIVDANARYAALAGVAPSALVGVRPPFPWWSASGRLAAGERLASAIAGAASEPIEIETVPARDGARTVLVAHAPLAAGRPEEGAVEVATDITAVRRAERTEAALARIAVAAVDPRTARQPIAGVAIEARRLLDATGAWVLTCDALGVWRIAWADTVAGAALIPGADAHGDSVVPHRLPALAQVLDGAPAGRSAAPGSNREYVAVPIAGDGTVDAALVVAGSPGGRLPEDAEAGLTRVAQLAGLTISRARTVAEVERAAVTDGLTGLGNDRSLRLALAAALADTAPGSTGPTALALVRADGIEGSGDLLAGGRGAGRVIRLGETLRAAARSADHLARVSGDVVAWVMPGADAGRAAALIERVRAALAEDGADPLTICAGLAATAPGERDARALVAGAEAALAHAVETGPDRVSAHDPSHPPGDDPAERARRRERSLSVSALRALARAVDAKDPDTRLHSERVADLAGLIATAMRWPAARVARLRDAALVHDIGKIGVPDAVLFKPGPLDAAEWERVRGHAGLGAEIAAEVLDAEQIGWVRHHHERWDGAGYPAGLAGEAVPDGARVLAVADSLDVMTSVRTYKRPLALDDALDEVRRCAGHQFDPAVAGALLRLAALGLLPRLQGP